MRSSVIRASKSLLCAALVVVSCAQREPDVHAGLSAREILNRTAARYSRATFYSDKGSVDRGASTHLKVLTFLQNGDWNDRFATRLVRGGNCEFRYTMHASKTFTAVGDATHGIATTPYRPPEQFDSWRSAVRTLVGVTAAAGIPATQLFNGERGAESILEMKNLQRLADDEVRGMRCAVIRGATPAQSFTLWIAPDFTLRRVERFQRAHPNTRIDVQYDDVTIR
jgi:hypothetical protein